MHRIDHNRLIFAGSALTLASALLCLSLFAAAPLSAQTLLLSVRETSGGTGLPAPLPASESLQSTLFDRGFIVIDTPAAGPRPSTEELAGSARSAGAEAALQMQVEYKEAPRGGGLSQISAAARFTLIDAGTGSPRAKGVEEANNLSREKPLTRAELGREIGARVAAKIVAAFTAVKVSP
jgi:hypothetical protein